MIRRIFTFAVLAISLSAYTFFSGASCPTKSLNANNGNSRSLTCSSCHAANVVDVIITDGKEVQDGLFEFEVGFNNSIETSALQIVVSDNGDNRITNYGSNNPPQIGDLGVSLFYQFDRDKSASDPILFIWEAPQDFFEPVTLEIQGVLSNMDGTVDGDMSFYKRVTIQPNSIPTVKAVKVYPTIAQTEINVSGVSEATSTVQIVNILGKTVYSSSLSADALHTVDVSSLENGNYFFLAGEGKDAQTIRFVVQK